MPGVQALPEDLSITKVEGELISAIRLLAPTPSVGDRSQLFPRCEARLVFPLAKDIGQLGTLECVDRGTQLVQDPPNEKSNHNAVASRTNRIGVVRMLKFADDDGRASMIVEEHHGVQGFNSIDGAEQLREPNDKVIAQDGAIGGQVANFERRALALFRLPHPERQLFCDGLHFLRPLPAVGSCAPTPDRCAG